MGWSNLSKDQEKFVKKRYSARELFNLTLQRLADTEGVRLVPGSDVRLREINSENLPERLQALQNQFPTQPIFATFENTQTGERVRYVYPGVDVIEQGKENRTSEDTLQAMSALHDAHYADEALQDKPEKTIYFIGESATVRKATGIKRPRGHWVMAEKSREGDVTFTDPKRNLGYETQPIREFSGVQLEEKYRKDQSVFNGNDCGRYVSRYARQAVSPQGAVPLRLTEAERVKDHEALVKMNRTLYGDTYTPPNTKPQGWSIGKYLARNWRKILVGTLIGAAIVGASILTFGVAAFVAIPVIGGLGAPAIVGAGAGVSPVLAGLYAAGRAIGGGVRRFGRWLLGRKAKVAAEETAPETPFRSVHDLNQLSATERGNNPMNALFQTPTDLEGQVWAEGLSAGSAAAVATPSLKQGAAAADVTEDEVDSAIVAERALGQKLQSALYTAVTQRKGGNELWLNTFAKAYEPIRNALRALRATGAEQHPNYETKRTQAEQETPLAMHLVMELKKCDDVFGSQKSVVAQAGQFHLDSSQIDAVIEQEESRQKQQEIVEHIEQEEALGERLAALVSSFELPYYTNLVDTGQAQPFDKGYQSIVKQLKILRSKGMESRPGYAEQYEAVKRRNPLAMGLVDVVQKTEKMSQSWDKKHRAFLKAQTVYMQAKDHIAQHKSPSPGLGTPRF